MKTVKLLAGILGIVIAKVVILEKEKQESNIPEQKSIRMDIYVEDEGNTVYNVEMQVEDKRNYRQCWWNFWSI